MTISAPWPNSPVELLQRLIRFNTTNPPGHEAEAIAFVNDLLTKAGVESKLFALSPDRPNLVARFSGQGRAAPLLLYGHMDVVTAANQPWKYPPFGGQIIDGYVWGRGALDMKGGLAMMLAACLRAQAEQADLPGDVILAIVSDEENGGDFGAKYLVEQHPALFTGVRYALGEFGGFSIELGSKRFYPIMVAEKQMCVLKATLRGAGGHGSIPLRAGALAKLARLIQKLERPLPVHIIPSARLMIESAAKVLPAPTSFILRQLLKPALTETALNLLGEFSVIFAPLLHNTVTVTMVQGSDKINVIPSQAEAGLDGRLLPGYKPDDLINELRSIVGPEVEFEVIRHDPGPAGLDMGLFDVLARILSESDPHGEPIPLLLSAVTDGRFFSRLGIQTYGFLPMCLPSDFNFTQAIHAANERIPVDALMFGAETLYHVLQQFR